MSELKAYMDSIGVDKYPESWDKNYDEAIKKVDAGLEVLTPEYLNILHTKYEMFSDNFDYVLKCAEKIRASRALSLYVALIASITDDLLFQIPKLNIPSAPDADSFEYNAASMFGLLHTIPDSVARYQEHNVPWNMIKENLEHFEGLANGVDNPILAYMDESVHACWFHIGNLCYELPHRYSFDFRAFKSKSGDIVTFSDGQTIHRSGYILGSTGCEDTEGSFIASITETPDAWTGYAFNDMGVIDPVPVTLNKHEWSEVLNKESLTILVHIPPHSLDPDGVSKSFKDAEAFFREHYPELHPTAFVCASWTMERRLSTFLSPDSKIVKFQKMFHPFNEKESSFDLFYFVFNGNSDVASFPENTSLERGIKNYFLNGGYLYSGIGYRLIENPW